MSSEIFRSYKKVRSYVNRAIRRNNNVEREQNLFIEDGINGFLLSVKTAETKLTYECFLPEETLVLILSNVDFYDLAVNCRLVCRSWKRLVENFALKYKTERERTSSLINGIVTNKKKTNFVLEWPLYYWILKKDIFGRNLLKNNCGQEDDKYWILRNQGCIPFFKFMIEDPPIGSDPTPDVVDFNGYTSCFVSSFEPRMDSQLIDLYSEGLGPIILDKHQPIIVVSEWYAGRFDCGCCYNIYVKLLDETRDVIAHFQSVKTIKQWEGRDWKKVSWTFKDYGPGIRYVFFCHGGSDTQFWEGSYGSKFGGGSVKVFYQLREEPLDEECGTSDM